VRFGWWTIVASSWLLGCSSGGGLDPSTNLVDLTPPQMMQLCTDSAPNGTGLVKCPNGTTAMVDTPDTCESLTWSADCTATVADSKACTDKLNADACSANLLADEGTVPCLLTQSCAGNLCSAMCLCSGSATTCLSSCMTFTAGLTSDCAACIAGLYRGSTCPDFSALPPPYDQCAAKCTGATPQTDAGP
jgi:hypothetical protein